MTRRAMVSTAGLLLALWAMATLGLVPRPAILLAESDAIRLVSSSVTSEFPEGMRFEALIEGEEEITTVAVRFRVGQETRGVYEYLEFEPGETVAAELFWRTNTSVRYIPPGTIIAYNFEIEDSAGNRLDTDRQEFIYVDARFQWEEVEEGPVAVAYHGPVKTRAEIVLDAIIQTMDHMGPLLGADTTIPIRVTMYNNVKEMLPALPPGSTTIRRELITEGQAFTNLGTLLVLGGGRGATGTASHEVTHILTHRAGDSILRNIPSWLDEGLAEYGNIDPGFSYEVALEFALATDRLLPITSMPTLPGDPEDVIIFYGQAQSIVRFMVAGYGPEKIRDLMAVIKTGSNIDDAIEDVYGMTRIELENQWRDTIGAEDYLPPERERSAPTPISRREMQLFTLTPQAGSETIAGMEATPTSTPDPTPTPAPTPTAEPTPTPAPTPNPSPTPALDAPTATPGTEAQARVEETDAPGSASRQTEPSTSGSCSAPQHPDAGLKDLTMPAIFLGLVGLGLRTRRR